MLWILPWPRTTRTARCVPSLAAVTLSRAQLHHKQAFGPSRCPISDMQHGALQACQPREGGSTSLIKLDIASHPASEARADADRVPAGLEFWSVKVDITQLEVVFLYRFLQVSIAIPKGTSNSQGHLLLEFPLLLSRLRPLVLYFFRPSFDLSCIPAMRCQRGPRQRGVDHDQCSTRPLHSHIYPSLIHVGASYQHAKWQTSYRS